ncbi:MAG: hemolysin III family protein [Elusimicrobiota bacterium]
MTNIGTRLARLEVRRAFTATARGFDTARDAVPEIWSMRLSLLGAILAVPAIASLLIPALAAHSPAHIFSFAAYGAGTLSMFLASAAFHSRAGHKRGFLKGLDYCAIAFLLAGSFTPYCTIALRTTLGYWVLAFIWTAALIAIRLRISRPDLSKWTFISLYLSVGWFGALVAHPVLNAIGTQGAGLTVLAGTIYTVGTLVFNRNEAEVEPAGFGQHEIWHLFIIGGAVIQFLVLRLYMMPA